MTGRKASVAAGIAVAGVLVSGPIAAQVSKGQELAVQGDIAVGDCVAVEQGSSANVRRVSDTYCDNAGHAALSAPEVTVKAQEDAADCHVAKQAALNARTEQETDIALKKVRVFCEG